MRLVQFLNGDQVGVGVMRGTEVVYAGYPDMLAFIRDGERALDGARTALANGRPVRYDKLTAPITNSGKIFGSGPNYLGHGKEDPEWVPAEEPQWDFIKLTSSVTGPYDDIVLPPADDVIRRGPGSPARFAEEHGFAVDYEVEFGVVMGRRARNVRREDALDHVFGYTIIDDVGSRSVQFHFNQRDLGKNFDTFCPMGPCIVTPDEIPDVRDVRIESYVNGELRQSELVADQLNLPGCRDRVAELGDHARARRRPQHRDAGRLRDLHGPAVVPQAGRRGPLYGQRDRLHREPRGRRHRAHASAGLSGPMRQAVTHRSPRGPLWVRRPSPLRRAPVRCCLSSPRSAYAARTSRCGTAPTRIVFPIRQGHEFSGRVLAFGPATTGRWRSGSSAPSSPCCPTGCAARACAATRTRA